MGHLRLLHRVCSVLLRHLLLRLLRLQVIVRLQVVVWVQGTEAIWAQELWVLLDDVLAGRTLRQAFVKLLILRILILRLSLNFFICVTINTVATSLCSAACKRRSYRRNRIVDRSRSSP